MSEPCKCPAIGLRAICGVCKHFDFNGEPVESKQPNLVVDQYAGKGRCRLHERREEPKNTCSEFSCDACNGSNKNTSGYWATLLLEAIQKGDKQLALEYFNMLAVSLEDEGIVDLRKVPRSRKDV